MDNISESDYKKIVEAIKNEESVVGIDAKKTHIMIIYMLRQLENKLGDMEQRLKEIENRLHSKNSSE